MCAKAKEDKEAKAAKKAAAKEEKAAKAKAKAKPKKKASTGTEDYNFFLLHGEKIGIAVALLVFAGLVASGSGLDKFTLTPEQINSSSSSAETTIKDSKVTPKEYDEGVVVYPFDSYAELIKSNVKVNSYETATRWEQSLFPDKIKRPNVVPLPLENLRAVACVGAIMYNAISANGAGGGMGGGMAGGGMAGGGMGAGGMGGGMTGGMGAANGELQGRHWITLTGSIPIRKQQLAYNELFGNAQYTDDQRDQPRYIYFTLERGVVDPTGKTDWKKVDVISAIQKENQRWSGIGSDQVGYNYMAPTWSSYPPMAMSCPPMANKPFGEEIANLPNIPLSSTEQIDVQASDVKEWNELQEAMKKFDESDLLSRNPFADVSMGGGTGMAGGMSGGMGMTGGMGMGGGMTGFGMETGGGMGMSGGASGGAVGGNSWLVNQDAINESRMKIQQAASVDYYLFRYFDFEVEPDKTYVYRVKLILGNPNYGVEERFVEDPSTLDQTFVESEFSAPSNPVALGAISRVLAENVEASSRPGAEPRITLSSVYFDEEDASESIIQGQSLKRGQIANFYSQKHDAVSVAGGRSSSSMYDAMGMGSGSGSKKGGKPKNKSVDHISNICVVDALGGAKISGVTLRSPGKVLFLEPNGLLQVHEVKEDARELGRYDGSAGGMGMGMGTGAAGMMM